MRVDPLGDPGLTRVDLLPAADETNDHGPVAVPVEARIRNSGSEWSKCGRFFFCRMNLVVWSLFHARWASSKSATCSIGGRDESTRHSSRK